MIRLAGPRLSEHGPRGASEQVTEVPPRGGDYVAAEREETVTHTLTASVRGHTVSPLSAVAARALAATHAQPVQSIGVYGASYT